jgi:hypothetical protein
LKKIGSNDLITYEIIVSKNAQGSYYVFSVKILNLATNSSFNNALPNSGNGDPYLSIIEDKLVAQYA